MSLKRQLTAVLLGFLTALPAVTAWAQESVRIVGTVRDETNAIALPGTPVEVKVARHGDEAVLEVTDQGPGMAPEVAARAFERFFRADPSRSRHRGGSGLGLAIVEATVHAHGGDVSITTADGAGTTVRVELPATPPPAHSDL